MLGNLDVRRDIVIAWRLAVAIAISQLIGGVATLLANWPTSISIMPGMAQAPMQFWFGAVFASPFGFLGGLAWHQFSGVSLPRAFVVFCAIACVVLLSVGFILLAL